MARGRKFSWHSGSADMYNLIVHNDFEVKGDFTFGDASTDTLTVKGKLDANGDVDLGSGDDDINIGSGSGDTVVIKEHVAYSTGKKATGDTAFAIPGITKGSDMTIVSTGTASVTITSGSGEVNFSDHLNFASGQTIKYPSESTAGTATLVGGSVTLAISTIDSADLILLSHLASAGTVGVLVCAVTAGTLSITSNDPVSGGVQTDDANKIAWLSYKVV